MNLERVRDVATGKLYHLDPGPRIDGGEAFIFPVRGEPAIVAKIYRKDKRTSKDDVVRRAAKLSFMLENPPSASAVAKNHYPYAWPTALLASPRGGTIVGFVMPRVRGMKEVFAFYNPAQRRQTCAFFNYRYLYQTARNIAGIMAEVHSKGYVVGDVNQKNIFVSDSALVTLLDTDSFQIHDPKSGLLHLCRVRTDGFIAPEVYRIGRDDVVRTVEQDLFGLSVLIFLLLMEGVHPFSCRYLGDGEPPKLQQSVIAGAFPYGRRIAQYAPMPTALPFEILPPSLRSLFVRCFVDGHDEPSKRPTAKEWQMALSKATDNLQTCTTNGQHVFGNHLGTECPWCVRVRLGLRDSFPSRIDEGPINPTESIDEDPDTATRVGLFARHKRIVWFAAAVLIVALIVLFGII